MQYLKGTHPDFRDPPVRPGGGTATVLQTLADASPIGLEAQDGQLTASNPGTPERPSPEELKIRLDALRSHLAQLITEAKTKNVPDQIQARFVSYAEPLTQEQPIYLLLDGPMSFLKGGCNDSYVTDGLDGGFVAGWKQLVDMHDDLRPLLLPPEEDDADLPDVSEDATPEQGSALVDQAIEAFDDPSVNAEVVDTLRATREYFEAAKTDETRKPNLIKRGMKAIGGIVALAASGTGIHAWATSPAGQSVLQKLQPVLDAVLKLFGG